MDFEMQELLESFIVETQEILVQLDQELMALETGADDRELLNSVFRSFHTLKGTSAFMGFDQITQITHEAEDLLNKLRHKELEVNSEIVDVLLEVLDWLKVLARKVVAGDRSLVDFRQTMRKLGAILHGEEALKQAQNNDGTSAAQDSKILISEAELRGNEAISMVLDNPAFGSGEGGFTDNELEMLERAFEQVDREIRAERSAARPKIDHYSEIPAAEETELKQDAVNMDPDSAPHDKHEKSDVRKRALESTIRVEVERLEALMDLSGELVLGRNRLEQITAAMMEQMEDSELVRELAEASSQVNYVTAELQSAVMKMRMVPISRLFQKAPRIIRDLSREFDKKIELNINGEETELDRGIVDQLSDPLVHMIRNACDHGIETPEERLNNGKPESGSLRLEADHEGNHIVIRIIDDGRGIDPQKLRNSAVDKKIITAEHAMLISDREALNLIFAPGFSTAATVTTVSGRGVGMDVVRNNIQKLKGIIDIESTPGRGTSLTIKLPLTLAIIQGLLVGLGGETFAVPLNSVVEVVALDQHRLEQLNGNNVIRIRNLVIPLLYLCERLAVPGLTQHEAARDKYVVVVGLADYRVGLVVERLEGQQEIVIKNLGEYLGNVNGIAGSTILGNGQVVMILDIVELIETCAVRYV